MIRPATVADAPALARILGDWARETDWMPVLHSREEDEGFVRLMIEGVDVWCEAGCRGLIIRDCDEVMSLFVTRCARGRGLGAALLDTARTGRDRLTLWTFEANAGARRFYAREGFREVARTDGLNEEELPDVRLEWRRR